MTPQQIRQAQVLKISEKAQCRNRRGTKVYIPYMDGMGLGRHYGLLQFCYAYIGSWLLLIVFEPIWGLFSQTTGKVNVKLSQYLTQTCHGSTLIVCSDCL